MGNRSSARSQVEELIHSNCKTRHMKLPELHVYCCYDHGSVRAYLAPTDTLGQDDFDYARKGFHPMNNLVEYALEKSEEPVVEYRIEPISDFKEHIDKRERSYAGVQKEWDRVQQIIGKLRNGETAFPVLFLGNDPSREIREGNHRVVAFRLLNFDLFPVFIMRYPSLELNSKIWPGQSDNLLQLPRQE